MILHDIERAERSELEGLQLSRLRATAERVYERVPFYRERFDEAGVKPEDIRTLDDVRRLPFTTKSDLRAHYPFGLLAVDLTQCVRLHASSGTSGKPTVVAYTKRDIDHWADIVARALAIAGGKPGDVVHNAYGYGLFTGGLGLHYGSERLGAVTVPVSGGNTERQIMIIEDFRPTIICGTPSYVLNIAERMKELGKDPRQTSLKYGIFGAEPWSEEMRRTLEETFDIKACDIYGLSEVIGPGVAMECHEAQDGLHIAEDHFFVEVINPNTLEPVGEGEEGELVFTSLTKEAFPVIRYRTGDIASVTRERCACGRTTVRMSRVKGRVDDMIIIRGVNVFPSEIEHHLLRVSELAPHYQLHRFRHGHLEAVELHAEVTDDFYSQIGGDLQSEQAVALARRVQSLLKTHCLVSIGVRLHPPKTLPRSEGKAVRVIDRRKFEAKQSV
ncbi:MULTISPECIES: phenylacetate--CoA ligase PaaK [Geobacillus]|jgi:phenylacetate-CoA ligase|uniref:Phenylacetate-coenzyme A ligase n=2 Tax=Geobacillus thermodenitrificans TaxID=33940 RepID=A0ABY9QBR1_GEOTD|nr:MULTISPECIES: phenylacetate--CoA ligase PaaK [Geobacillus]ARA99493.1 phenylacetate--CoA ligase [Geobacillus thermodenitrificans]ARP43081.1 Phenylacetate-coenzyme A ligase [Geobacillus thermodenitrificans]ATO38858.1 phenylacetate--CoA ligase [Geobacillus thermodenitrificans]MEC5189260.1 phenylacetate-CoA ligase [Geobacillus thermodenitrificans]MED0662061.1 phenylacetate--CoA ligase [Geobacillus thermodenitrificans]